MKQTENLGNLDVELTCLVLAYFIKGNFPQRGKKFVEWFRNKKMEVRHGSRTGPFVDGEQICLQALLSISDTETIIWNLPNFYRV